MYQAIVKCRSWLLVLLTHQLALPFLKLLRKPVAFKYSLPLLLQFPPGTVGRDMAELLQQQQLALLPFYARHDIKHLLLQYDTTDKGEVCLQAFMLGNKHVSVPAIATVLFGILTMPEHWVAFRKAFRRGRATPSLSLFNWEACITSNTQSLIHQLHLHETSFI